MQCLPPVEDQIVRHGVERLRQSRSPPEVDRFPPEMVFAFLLLYERVTLYLSFLFIAKYCCTEYFPDHPGRRKSYKKVELIYPFHVNFLFG